MPASGSFINDFLIKIFHYIRTKAGRVQKKLPTTEDAFKIRSNWVSFQTKKSRYHETFFSFPKVESKSSKSYLRPRDLLGKKKGQHPSFSQIRSMQVCIQLLDRWRFNESFPLVSIEKMAGKKRTRPLPKTLPPLNESMEDRDVSNQAWSIGFLGHNR